MPSVQKIFCFVVLMSFISPGTATASLEYFARTIPFNNLPYACGYEGGTTLLHNEALFSSIQNNDAIPYGAEFWIAEYLYTHWMFPIRCVRRSDIDTGTSSFAIQTSSVLECYTHCRAYTYFAIHRGFCRCLQTFGDTIPGESVCSDTCDDIGPCGGFDSTQTIRFVTVYETHNVFDSTTSVQVPGNIANTGFTECLTARCSNNDYRTVDCQQNVNYGGLCLSDELTAATDYTTAQNKCLQKSGDYMNAACSNVTNLVVFLGPIRFTFTVSGVETENYDVAKGAKCTKFNNNVNCIATTEKTELPFVCKMNTPAPVSTTLGAQDPKGDGGGGGDTTAIVIGVVVGIIFICVTVIIVVVVSRRNKKSKDTFNNPQMEYQTNSVKNPYEKPKPREHTYDHVYADTTDVYHPYIEIQPETNSTTYRNQNEIEANGVNNGGLQTNGLQVPTNGSVLNTNDINVSMLNVDNQGYLDPKKSPNVGRKLPEVPNVRL